MSFEQLQQKFYLPSKFFFKYLQVRHYIQTQQGGRLSNLPLSPLEDILSGKSNPKGLVSFIYGKLSHSMAGDLCNAKSKWEKDLECSFDDNEWEIICEKAQTLSINSRHKLIQFNVIHRVYYTPVRLHTFKSTYSELCPRCKVQRGTLLHMLWSCPDLEVYWEGVLEIIGTVVGTNIPREPRLTLLGDTSLLDEHKGINLRFVRLALLAAIKCITLRWKDSKPPTTSMWTTEVSSYVPLEKITFCLKKRQDLFVKYWGSFLSYMGITIAGQNT